MSREYQSYTAAKTRCADPNHISYPHYGGRGIEFRFTDFLSFYNELGPKPTPKHSVDRIKTEGHYEAGNVRWATRSEQQKNKPSYQNRHEVAA